MPHPFRRPLVIVSLLLLAACAVFWHRGNRQRETIRYSWDGGAARIELSSLDGDVVLVVQRTATPHRVEWVAFVNPASDSVAPSNSDTRWITIETDPEARSAIEIITTGTSGSLPIQLHGWRWMHWMRGVGVDVVRVPILLLMVIAAIAPLSALRRVLIVRRRQTRGLCMFCGYDLRHSSDRCPECGTPIVQPADDNSPKVETPTAS